MKHDAQREIFARDEAMARVEEAPANLAELVYLHALGQVLLKPHGVPFTASELLLNLERQPADRRVLGPVMRRLQREGWIRATSSFTTTGRSHGGTARLWRRAR